MDISFLHLSLIISCISFCISHFITMHLHLTCLLHTFYFHVYSCMIFAFSPAKQKQKKKHENSCCILSCICLVPWANHVGIINPFHLKTKWLNMVPNAWLTKNICFFGHLNFIITFAMHGVATYPSAGGRRETHGCVFQGRKMHGVATNVYLRETSKKPKRCSLRTLSVKGLGVVISHGEGISAPRVRHKGRQPLIKCAKSCLWFVLFSLFYVFMSFVFFFLPFCGQQGCFPRSYVSSIAMRKSDLCSSLELSVG